MSALSAAAAPTVLMLRDAVTGLGRELVEMRLTGARARRCTMTALAVALAVVVALAARVDAVWWAAISAFMCSQATAPASVQRGILRILGTMFGAGLAVLLCPWFVGDTVALSLILFAVSTVGVMGFLVSGRAYAWLLASITADMVLMALLSDPSSALTVGADRTAEVVIGTLAAMLMAVLMGPDAVTGAAPAAPGWSDLLGEQWPVARHALRAGFAVMLVPLVWNLLELPSLTQTAVTVAAVMGVPAVSHDAAADQRKITERAIHRIFGCVWGGVLGLACLALSVDDFLPWLLMLSAGMWITAHVQASERGIGYVGTQGSVVFISTLVQGPGPPDSILPGIERFVGISGGLLILLVVMMLTAPDRLPAIPTLAETAVDPLHEVPMNDIAGRQDAMPGKGLRKDALSFGSNVTIAISSVSPAYSIAATLGPIVGFAALGTPSIMVLAFVPMLFIAVACYHMNRADPDCGTTFSWVTRSMGPGAGWMSGWSIIVTNILVMPSLADISGRYSFRLFGFADPSAVEVAVAGVGWIVVLTVICYLGIALSARTQQWLLVAELGILVAFSVVALGQVYLGHAPVDAPPVSLGWFNPFHIGDFSRFTEAMVLAVFIYWGWDSCISVNEETKDPHIAPGYAAVVSTVILVGLYALVAVAAVAVAGPGLFAENGSDVLAPLGQSVLGASLGKILVLAVLSSAIASTQTSILPAARMALSMAHAGAIPEHFGRVHPHHLSPGVATLTMGVVSIVWYVGMTFLSADVLADSITALGLVIAFYYGLTAFSCVVYYRHEIVRSVGNFISMGVVPAAGGVIMFVLLAKSVFAPGEATTSQVSVLGIGGPVLIGVGAVLTGFLLMILARRGLPAFFERRREVAVRERYASPLKE